MSEGFLEARLRLVSEAFEDPVSASVARDEIMAAWDDLMRESKHGPAWARAERVEAAAAAVAKRVDELESCLNDRGRPSAPCHGQPMHALLDARDVLDTVLGGPK